MHALMAFIATEPAVKAPFFSYCIQKSLMGEYNAKWLIIFVCAQIAD